MTTSLRIARVAGIDLEVHVTFLLILAFGAMRWGIDGGLRGAVFGLLLTVLLFACVALHELGHALAAKAFGIATQRIILLPIGGIALLERMPRQPLHEMAIAVAGPIVNVGIAAALAMGIATAGMIQQPDAAELLKLASGHTPMALAIWLLVANTSLVLFNLVPAFPLDGGRVLRAGLALVLGHEKATKIAAMIGQIAAVALGVLGLWGQNYLLVLVAVFIFLGAGREGVHVAASSVLARLTAGDVCRRNAETIGSAETVASIAGRPPDARQPEYAVIDQGELQGVVSHDDLLHALTTGRGGVAVAWIMTRDVPTVAPTDTLEQVRQAMAQAGRRVVAVMSGGAFVGIVSLEDLARSIAGPSR